MTNYAEIETRLQNYLKLSRRPVAITFCDESPESIDPFEGRAPAGCSFWRLAADGRSFYTAPGDHYNCAIGCHTHRIDLPVERASELEQTLSLMSGIGYLKMEEVPGIPRLAEAPQAVVYTPLADTPADPDVVLLCGAADQLSLLQEAAWRVGAGTPSPLFGRPTCMALPAAMDAGMAVSSACIGNRVYTEIDGTELYLAIRGQDLPALLEALAVVADANHKLFAYHQERKQEIAAAEA